MIAYYAKRSAGEEFTKVHAPLDTGVWVDCSNASDSELDTLVNRYKLDANIVYDVRDRQELPRVELSRGTMYVFMRVPHRAKSGNITSLPLLCILTGTTFITASIGDTIAPDSLRLSTVPVTTDHTQTLLLGVIAGSISEFEKLIKHTARSINDTANRLRTHEITNRDFIHFVTVEENLNHYKLNLDSTLVAVKRLRENHSDSLSRDSEEVLDDIILHIQQLLVAVTSHRQSVDSIRNAYSTVANNALSQRMKTLTVFTVLIALPNVFYGMYGMNVVLPFAKEPWAYVAVVGFSLFMIIVVFTIAKRLRIF